MSATAPLPLSVLILTLNEEANLPGCLRSVSQCEDVVVLDSGSTDRTVEIALAAGARVYARSFTNFANQRNYAHDSIPFRHPWVFHLDADEVMTPELAAECAALPEKSSPDGYYTAPHMMLNGRWMKRCTDFPAWQARCVRAKGFRFIQVGHGQREAPEMKMGYLKHSYQHDISTPNPAEWEAKHRRYARDEAMRYLSERRPLGRTIQSLANADRLERRRAMKQLSYFMPLRPALRFIYQYIFRLGFTDAVEAMDYCLLLARYERFISEEIKRQSNE